MTDTPTPSKVAMDAARALDGLYREAEPDERWPAVSHAADYVQRAIDAAVKPVEAERAALARRFERARDAADTAQELFPKWQQRVAEAEQERDAARAAVGELRTALERARAAMWDAHYGKGIATEYARKVDDEIRAALAATQQEGEKP